MFGPLRGLRVLELGRYISAPYAAKVLADLGAEVVKVENPNGGDPLRDWQGDAGDQASARTNPQFSAYNQGKKSIALDFKSPADRDRLMDLVRDADAVIENFRPGVARRLAIDWPDLRAVNPRLVYCSITGFGTNGPYAHRPAYDTVVSALSGLYSLLVNVNTSPRLVGPAMSDLVTGMFAAHGILAALVARATSGTGQRVDITMLGAMAAFLREPIQTYLDTGEVTLTDTRLRRGGGHVCVAGDGLPFVVHASVPSRFWKNLLRAFGRSDLESDERFNSRAGRYDNYYELDAILKAEAATKPREEWLKLLDLGEVPHAPLNFVDEVLADPQFQHLVLVKDLDDDRAGCAVRGPFAFDSDPVDGGGPAPLLGEHSDGFSWSPRGWRAPT